MNPLAIAMPATQGDIGRVEKALGFQLPSSFRRVLSELSSAFAFSWYLPAGLHAPPPLSGIFSGEMSWDLARLVELDERRRGWVQEVFPSPDDPYDRIWHGKLAIHEVANGDYLALDLERADAPLVYLSHDDGEGHGYILGHDFEDAMDRWTQLGCVGAEDWQWLPFVTSPDSCIDPVGENASRWKAWFFDISA